MLSGIRDRQDCHHPFLYKFSFIISFMHQIEYLPFPLIIVIALNKCFAFTIGDDSTGRGIHGECVKAPSIVWSHHSLIGIRLSQIQRGGMINQESEKQQLIKAEIRMMPIIHQDAQLAASNICFGFTPFTAFSFPNPIEIDFD